MAMISGIYTGISTFLYGPDQYDTVDGLLKDIIDSGAWNNVVSICMVPHGFFSGTSTLAKLTQKLISFPTKLDGYTPRNKKLLTFPFSFFQVDTVSDVKDYRYELMADYGFSENFRFMIYGAASPNPEMLVCPYYYDGVSGGEVLGNPSVGCIIADFPQCAYPIDSYRAWVAQKGTAFNLNLAGQIASTALNAASGNLAGAILGTVGLAGTINNAVVEQSIGNHIQGNQGGSVTVGSRTKGIFFKYMSVEKGQARSIDDFFDRYGYTTERLKVPNRTVRPHWCYTKTKNCAITGTVPGMYARQIEAIYNQGVTFWKNISEVGNYSLSNSV